MNLYKLALALTCAVIVAFALWLRRRDAQARARAEAERRQAAIRAAYVAFTAELTTALIPVFQQAVTAFAEFTETMSGVVQAINDTGPQMDQLRRFIAEAQAPSSEDPERPPT